MKKSYSGKLINNLLPLYVLIIIPILGRAIGSYGNIINVTCLYCLLSLLMLWEVWKRKSICLNKIDILISLFICWLSIRIFTSSIPIDYQVISILLLSLFIYTGVRLYAAEHLLPYILFIQGCVQALIGILQSYNLFPHYNMFFNISGTFDTPAMFGASLIFASLSGFFLFNKNKKSGVIIIPLLSMILYSLYLSQSRAAWIALLFGIIYNTRNFLKKYRTTSSILFIIAMILLYIIRPASVIGRLYIYLISLNIFCDAPLIGHGISSFKAMYMPAQGEWLSANKDSIFGIIADDNILAFNELLHIGCESGIIGVILFVAIITSCVLIKHENNYNLQYLKCILIAFFIFSLFSYPFNETIFILLFFIISAAINNNDNRVIVSFKINGLICLAMSLLLIIGITANVRYGRNCIAAEKDIANTLPKLSESALYMGRYGERLFNSEEYEKAIPVLEKYCTLSPNSRMLDILGVCYQKEKLYDYAITAYTHSAEMVPSRILPHYHLFKLYIETKQYEKAKEYAVKILRQKVKVVNSTVIRIRNEARSFLHQDAFKE